MIYIEIEPINIPKPESLVLGKEDSEIELFSFIEEEKPYLKVHKLNQDEQNTKLICSINEGWIETLREKMCIATENIDKFQSLNEFCEELSELVSSKNVQLEKLTMEKINLMENALELEKQLQIAGDSFNEILGQFDKCSTFSDIHNEVEISNILKKQKGDLLKELQPKLQSHSLTDMLNFRIAALQEAFFKFCEHKSALIIDITNCILNFIFELYLVFNEKSINLEEKLETEQILANIKEIIGKAETNPQIQKVKSITDPFINQIQILLTQKHFVFTKETTQPWLILSKLFKIPTTQVTLEDNIVLIRNLKDIYLTEDLRNTQFGPN